MADLLRSEDVTPVGIVEIAEIAGVLRATVDKWRTRGLLPPEHWTVGGRPAWRRHEIVEWLRETGRLPSSREELTDV